MIATLIFLLVFYVAVRIAGTIILLRYPPVVVSDDKEKKEATFTIEPGQPELTLNVLGADVDLRRSATATDISVVVNDASQWSVAGGQITQTSFNGINCVFGALSLQLSGIFSLPLVRDLYNICALIRGKPIVQVVLVPSSTLVVTVPADYTGDLTGTFGGSGTFNLESWTGGNVNLKYASSGDAVIGSLTGLKSFVLQQSSFGAVNLSGIESNSIAIDCDGSGDLVLSERVSASSMRMAVTSFGDAQIQQDVNATESFILLLDGSGSVEINGTVNAGVFDVRVLSFGDLTVGDVIARNPSMNVSGSGSITVRNVTADKGVVVIDLSSFGGMNASSIRAGRVEITTTGSADVEVDRIEATSVESRLTSFGGITVNQLRAEHLDVRCSGSGDFTASGCANGGYVERSSFGDVTLHGQFNCGWSKR